MSETFRIFVVDDDSLVLDVIRSILEPGYVVESFSSAEECMNRLATEKPGMFLLDVRMPGMDGYTFCRQIKDDAGLCQIPVTFVSSQDTIDARLKGYDAGGEDFIVKPFQAEEVLRKVQVAQRIAQGKHSLVQQLEDSELLSSLVMSNMDEYAILVRFMRELISWENEQEIAAGMLEMLQRYRLEGVVQTRISQRTLTLSAQGANLPLETSVLNHVRGLERIFEFRNRSVYNFERLTLMVNNMPVHDPDYCGRLRDHLCIAAESAEASLKALETEEANHRSQAGIRGALGRVHALTAGLHQSHLRDKAASSELFMRMDQSLAKSFVHLGMTEDQEQHLGDLINGFMKELMELLDRSEETHESLQELSKRLGQLTPVTP
ncbi:MAG: response regulator [Sterolibacterium sp.]|nr:response regulator [Sterolibacterium sp.]